jgi:hypothetical protein
MSFGLSRMMNQNAEGSSSGRTARALTGAPVPGGSAGARGGLAWAASRQPMPMIAFVKRPKAQHPLELHDLAALTSAKRESRVVAAYVCRDRKSLPAGAMIPPA